MWYEYMIALKTEESTHIDHSGSVSQPQIMHNPSLIQKGQVRNIIHPIELRRVHLRQRIRRDAPNLNRLKGCQTLHVNNTSLIKEV